MLYTEWNMDDAIAVAREEGKEEGHEEGIEEGRINEKIEIARNLLAEGSTPDFIQKITGLDIETIKALKKL